MDVSPSDRHRRLRRTAALRRAHTETRLHPADLVLPLFVKEGLARAQPIGSMPGVSQHSVASAVALVRDALRVGVESFILFGIPEAKDATGSGGWAVDGPVPAAARAIKDAVGDDAVIWADVCSCEYTDHGHCGPLDARGSVINDAAVAGYAREAVVYADAGCDVIAPSGMMDGQVAAIRAELDDAAAGDVPIVAYAAKYASAFYGPFRDAAESGMVGGDRADHQIDPGNRRVAIREALADIEQGADVVMVKPALAYLDIIREIRNAVDVPVAAYHVSGEYSMIKAAAERGWIDGDRAMAEATLSIRRAGAGQVLSYAALDLARALQS
ncbi:MAG: porphobilinogen synthase [Nitriliruptoraceae bacterium]